MIRISFDTSKLNKEVEINLPSSKSISNRVLILNKISNANTELVNISEADDTQILKRILDSDDDEINCGLGGTTIRFYLAYCYLKNKKVIIKGEEALNSRIIHPLVDALRKLGATINYLNLEGYPPLEIVETNKINNEIIISDNKSSQFVSALLMIAPLLPQGIIINLPSNQVSKSYIKMTIDLMNKYGVKVDWENETLSVLPQSYYPVPYIVSGDWSAAVYWIGFLAIAGKGVVFLKGLKKEGLQGDEILLEWINSFGITYRITEEGIYIEKSNSISLKEFNFDLIENPDLAQPFAVIGAALGIRTTLHGLSTLRYKETDRLSAIKQELEKVGVNVNIEKDSLVVDGKIDTQKLSEVVFDTYNDHRMAMSLSLLSALNTEIKINHPEVVSKSYPDFFKELEKLCVITEQ